MIKKVLLCSDGSEHSRLALEASLQVAKKFEAEICALHVVESRDVGGSILADLSGAAGFIPYQNLYVQLNELFQERGKAILAVIEQACRDNKIPVTTLLKTGDLAGVVRDVEADMDLVVIGRNGEHLKLKDDFLGRSVERVIRTSTKPCLLTADRPRTFLKAVIAFDGSDNSKRALRAGLEFVKKMAMSADIITVDDGHSDEKKSALQLAARHAEETKVKVACHMLTGPPEEQIVKFAQKNDFDLIVMGAYGHSRIREFIIGSVTSSVIFRSPVPILLAHHHDI